MAKRYLIRPVFRRIPFGIDAIRVPVNCWRVTLMVTPGLAVDASVDGVPFDVFAGNTALPLLVMGGGIVNGEPVPFVHTFTFKCNLQVGSGGMMLLEFMDPTRTTDAGPGL